MKNVKFCKTLQCISKLVAFQNNLKVFILKRTAVPMSEKVSYSYGNYDYEVTIWFSLLWLKIYTTTYLIFHKT